MYVSDVPRNKEEINPYFLNSTWSGFWDPITPILALEYSLPNLSFEEMTSGVKKTVSSKPSLIIVNSISLLGFSST